MIPVRWYKVLNDLKSNITRTILIILSITAGLFAVGTIINAQNILSIEMAKSYAAINPSSGSLRTIELFDEAFVQAARNMKEIEAVQERRNISARIEINPGEWLDMQIFAVPDFDNMRVNIVNPQSGAWPPPEQQILIERSALAVINANIGDDIIIETGNKKTRSLHIAGTTHDMAQMPAQIDKTPYGYITFDTVEWLGEEYGFNQLDIVPVNKNSSREIQNAINLVKEKAEKQGYTIPISLTLEPGQLPLNDILQAILLLMGFLGVLSLFLSVFLIINTFTALLAQQKRQIGVMKAVGASSSQTIIMYLTLAIIYGIVSLLVACPLSIIGGRELSLMLSTMFNFDLANLGTPTYALPFQIIVGILVPVLASIVPLLTNLTMTASEALRSYDSNKKKTGTTFVDSLLSGEKMWRTRFVLMRSRLLSIRNTFRSKGRLVLTLITLTLAGAIFISVFSIQASLLNTIYDLIKIYNTDIIVTLESVYRQEKITQKIQNVPGITEIDFYYQLPTRRIRPDGSETGTLYLFSSDPQSRLFVSPTLIEGRWLAPEDENAVVITTTLLKKEEDLKIGDELVLSIKGSEKPFKIIGIGKGMPAASMLFTNAEYVAPLINQVDRTNYVLIKTDRHDKAFVTKTIAEVEATFKSAGMNVSSVMTFLGELEEMKEMFNIIIALLLVMAVLLALVGGLGLMGTMSINVLERTREIGVLRAIGAPNNGVSQVFILEGVAIGFISWLFGTLLSIPLGSVLNNALGITLIGVPLSNAFSYNGVCLWFVLAIGISALASYFPAQSASKLTVREVLAYE